MLSCLAFTGTPPACSHRWFCSLRKSSISTIKTRQTPINPADVQITQTVSLFIFLSFIAVAPVIHRFRVRIGMQDSDDPPRNPI
jgi:hypothetical protein